MKQILTIVLAAAALSSLASCQKEEPASNACDQNNVRIITASISNDGTKTTLGTDTVTPLWSAGDVIRVLDGTAYQDVTLVAYGSTHGTNEGVISEDGKIFRFATTLTGSTLYAVYPASATTMTNCKDGNITFTIPSVQDGTFASANICVARGEGSTTNPIYFHNATAVVEMSVASEVVGTRFAATNNVAGDMSVAMGTNGTISSTTTTSLSSSSISVSDTKAPAGSKFYLAVAPVETGAVSISCNTTSKTGSTNKTTKTLAKDKIYAMNLSTMTLDADFDLTGQHGVLNGAEYVIIKAKYDGTNDSYLKWATQNLAVTASGKTKWNGTDYIVGDYFQWAASYAGYGLTADAFKVSTNLVIYDSFNNLGKPSTKNSFTFKSVKTEGYVVGNAPHYGSNYTKYNISDSKKTLEHSDDVANIVLGSTWRIPTGGSTGQFTKMRAATYWAWDATDYGYYVFKPGVGTSGEANGIGVISGTDDKTKALLFLPAAGYGEKAVLHSAGEHGYYWSSTVRSDSIDYARELFFNNANIKPEDLHYRYIGFSVRPVSD